MKKISKIYVAGACCIVAGILMTASGIAAGGWPGISIGPGGISYTSVNHNQSKSYVLEKTKLDEFDNINIQIDYADIEIIPSDGFYLEYRLAGAPNKPEYKVENNTLSFRENPGTGSVSGIPMFLSFGSFDFEFDGNEKYYFKLYLPSDKVFNAVKISNDSGDINAASLIAQDIVMNVEYGDVKAEAIEGENLFVTLDSGHFDTDKVKAGTLQLTNDYGKIKIRDLESQKAEIYLESGDAAIENGTAGSLTLFSSYGSVKFLHADISEGNIEMSSGDLKILDAVLGDLSVKSEYGGVDLNLRDDLDSYSMRLMTEYGSVDVPYDGSGKYISEDDEARFEKAGKNGKTLKVSCESGDISISSQK